MSGINVDGEVTERVHERLKTAIIAGGVSMHGRLDLAEMADLYAVSTTPIREAAMRLWGEGLLEPHPKGGLRAVLASEADLRALLDLHGQLSDLALARTSFERADDAPPDDGGARPLFHALVKRTGNGVLVDVLDRLGDRLATYGHHELLVFGQAADADLALIRAAWCEKRALRKALRGYYRRRLSHATELVWAATTYRPDTPSG